MKNNCKLLPHIRQDLYGSFSAQEPGWQIKKFNVPKYWEFSMGEGVTVGVIDTGCDIYHSDLKNNLVDGYNFVGSGDPIDDNGHGTHVSGIIAAANNTNGIVGIAPKTKIMPLKTMDANGSGNNNHVAEAIRYAADHGCDLITMSLGSVNPSSEIHNAILYANTKNVIIFCAAGNSGEKSPIMFPARYNETISIGSINENLQRSSFSCSGYELDFLCPGQNIFSCVPDNSYAIMSGTSMSAPFAVGCAALLLSYCRSRNLQQYIKNTEDMINIFKKSAKSIQNPKHAKDKKYQGNGILYPTIEVDNVL